MWGNHIYFLIAIIINVTLITEAFYTVNHFDCGPYGFICDEGNRVRLCDGQNLVGPAFNCPRGSMCNEESTEVCENFANHIDPGLTRNLRCHRNERIADPNIPDCKGYILCIPNKNRFQGIKFKCSGNTVFSGYTRTCTAPEKYKCPLQNTTKSHSSYYGDNHSTSKNSYDGSDVSYGHRTIDCKNYKFQVTQDSSPSRATYFCPSRPKNGEAAVRCTIFSNHFCITLERDSQDQFIESAGAAYRKPRKNV